jgi:hypothetical protein
MTEDKWKTLWSILVGATIITLIALVAYQQVVVKHRAIKAPAQQPHSSASLLVITVDTGRRGAHRRR